MQIYLVGGAVRDRLLNLSSNDNDWVVVGATSGEMLSLGFQAVGKDFPVFLHPDTNEEYALARTERKSGNGYTGFECYFSADVTLQEDLSRRDLTINAIAQDEAGNIIDPYGGQDDINNKLLRHVSAAFVEDPLRVLRVARFAAKLGSFGFTVAPETLALMKEIVDSGELNHLTQERVWQEWHKSLLTARPDLFLSVLKQCGALKIVIPEIDALFGVPQSEKWHPEIDSGIHTLMVTGQAALLSDSATVRFAAQLHDLGKGATPEAEWPSHKMHAQTGLAIIKSLCKRVKVPLEYRELALAVCAQHSDIHNAKKLDAAAFLKVLNGLDVWRRPQRLPQVLTVCEADHRGRKGMEHLDYPQKAIFEKAYHAALSVDVQEVIRGGFEGKHIRDELDRRRAEAIKQVLGVESKPLL